ncbi:molecular chaperone [Eggerthella guodeyinii]|uniref:Molecular chaperone TorD n=1 Tax=Eggerthella guodeyinii TaxID=2690837 RepID=A0A6N7RSB9_9ACTN|nr:molecular chaperone TorD family protein [Eggerthella guodeyinii]MRX83937.1 hypothetical protein [Eggerthella guodeyinii]
MENDRADTAAVYALFASVLVTVPDAEVRDRMARLLAAAGDEASAAVDEAADLEQCFYDRLVIAVSPRYLPAIESCMLDAREDEGGRLEPGRLDGPRMTEVLACYRTYGFDHRALRGFQPLVDSLRPDHLSVELAFMAHLRRLEAAGGEKGRAAGRFADEFLRRHLASWVPTLCAVARQRGEGDEYVRLIEAVRSWIDLDASAAA